MSVARYRYVVPLLDPHAPQLPVKPGKSRQIVAKETADARTSDQATSTDGWHFSGPMRYDFCRAERGRGGVARQANSTGKPDAGARKLTTRAQNPANSITRIRRIS